MTGVPVAIESFGVYIKRLIAVSRRRVVDLRFLAFAGRIALHDAHFEVVGSAEAAVVCYDAALPGVGRAQEQLAARIEARDARILAAEELLGVELAVAVGVPSRGIGAERLLVEQRVEHPVRRDGRPVRRAPIRPRWEAAAPATRAAALLHRATRRSTTTAATTTATFGRVMAAMHSGR